MRTVTYDILTNTSDCTAGLTSCVTEDDGPCFHCGTMVREHVDEDGTPRKVEPAQETVYLPIDCPVCGRRRVEWDGTVLKCEKCTTSSAWDGFTRERYVPGELT